MYPMWYYLISLRYSLKNFNVPIFFYHLVPWFTGADFVVLEHFQGGLGKSLQGTCDLRSSSRSSRYIVELGLYLFCFILSTCLIPRLLRKSGNLFPEIKKHFQYYLSYFIFANILLIVTFVAKFYEVETFDMFIHTEVESEAQDYILKTFIYEEVVIVIDQISPIILAIVRLFDPFLRKHWVKLFNPLDAECFFLGGVFDSPIHNWYLRIDIDMLRIPWTVENQTYNYFKNCPFHFFFRFEPEKLVFIRVFWGKNLS